MDYSRDIQCKNSLGGNKKVYIFPYTEHLDSQIVVEDNILTSFPQSDIYELPSYNVLYDIDGSNDKDLFFDEKISFQASKLSSLDKFRIFLQKDSRIIVIDNNNNIRLFGLRNGLIGTYKQTSATNRSEFNGYSFSFSGKEEYQSPYLNDLSFFNIIRDSIFILSDGYGDTIQDGYNNEILV